MYEPKTAEKHLTYGQLSGKESEAASLELNVDKIAGSRAAPICMHDRPK
jgi:hypothetical protein